MMRSRGKTAAISACLGLAGFLLALLACTDRPVQEAPIVDATAATAQQRPNLTYWYIPG